MFGPPSAGPPLSSCGNMSVRLEGAVVIRNFRIQATADGLNPPFIEREESPAVP